MEYFDELHKPKFNNFATLFINNPNKTSYLLLLGNDELKNSNDADLSHYGDLLVSLISDWSKGIYRKIPLKTMAFIIYSLYYVVNPKRTFVDKVPGVKLLKQIGLITMIIRSFKQDLIRYERWKESQKEFVEV